MTEQMTKDEAIEYLKSLDSLGSVLGLENMRRLSEELDNPQEGLRFVHVTGTNGKGSVCAFLSNILKEAGYKVGSYNSPAVLSCTDQFRINMEFVSDDLFTEALTLVKDACDNIVSEGGNQPTRFEVETMTAFVMFYIEKCDIVVLETGLGGRDDATNIINNTLLHIFASISMDHGTVLGHTLKEIAEVKSGIIKTSAPVLMYNKSTAEMSDDEAAAINDVKEVIFNKCIETQSNLYTISDMSISNVYVEAGKLHFDINEYDMQDITVSMPGAYQPINASIAISAARILSDIGYDISNKDIRKGIKKAIIPFRFEKYDISKKVDIILDGAHNPEGAEQLVKSLELVYPDREFIYITGIFKDKDYKEIARITAPKASRIYIIQNKSSERSLDKETLAKAFSDYNSNICVEDEIENAVYSAIDASVNTVSANGSHPVVICFGSLSWLNVAADYIRFIDKMHMFDFKLKQEIVLDEAASNATVQNENVTTEEQKADNNAEADNDNKASEPVATKTDIISDVKPEEKQNEKQSKKHDKNHLSDSSCDIEKLSVNIGDRKLDSEKIKEGIKLILEGIGEDISRAGLKDTPDRVTEMYEDIFSGVGKSGEFELAKNFPSDAKDMIVEKDIEFCSISEQNLLPFFGKAHIAYIPDGKAVGISELASCVDTYSKKPQRQENLTDEIADAIMKYLKPKGVLVMLEAEHMCMNIGKINKSGTKSVTVAARGKMQKKENKDLFFQLLK